MTVAASVTATLPRSAPTRAVEPLQGTQARQAATVQGHTWHGIGADREILQAVDVRRRLDERGDALLADLIGGLGRLAGLLKRERQYEAHSLAVDLAACALLIAELDDAEDSHDARIRDQAAGSLTSLGLANTILGSLLGQAEADAPCEILELPYPIDGAGICGRVRQPMGAIAFEVCGQLAGHELAGGVCVFVAVPPAGGATP